MCNLPIGTKNDPKAPWNEPDEVYECTECGKEMETDKGVCSTACHKASML